MSKYTYAVWKRKTASAQVRLFEWKGDNIINWIPINEYINRSDLFDVIYSPLKITKLKDNFYIEVKVSGSGESAQAQAIRHGIARALVLKDPNLRPILKEAWFLTRDARKVERKKPGLHKARKAVQWSKR
jgi:small subunit ribosomal protein S9